MSQTRKRSSLNDPHPAWGQCKEPIALLGGKGNSQTPFSLSNFPSIISVVSAMPSVDLTSTDSPRRQTKPKFTRHPALSVLANNRVALMGGMVALGGLFSGLKLA